MNELRYYDLGYTEVFVFDNYLINQIKEGETVVVSHAKTLQAMIDKHFHDRKMIYISNRIHSYALDPLIYLEVSKIKNLVGMGIVVYSEIKQKTATFEKQFCSIPYEVFNSMEEAIVWAKHSLKDKREVSN